VKDEFKTKEQLIGELVRTRQQVSELEALQRQVKRFEEKIDVLGKFPLENPDPVLYIAKDGLVIYVNPASRPLIDEWGWRVGRSVPDDWKRFIKDTIDSKRSKELEVNLGDRIFSGYFRSSSYLLQTLGASMYTEQT
jgi:hypothetical protein